MLKSAAWLYLIIAIITEVAGTTAMKFSVGFTHLQPSILIVVFYTFSFLFFALSIRQLDLGFAYATWSGLGTLLISGIGIAVFNEPVTAVKVVSLLFIIIGVMGLKEP